MGRHDETFNSDAGPDLQQRPDGGGVCRANLFLDPKGLVTRVKDGTIAPGSERPLWVN